MKMSQAEWQKLLNRLRENDPTLNSLTLKQEGLGDKEAQELALALENNYVLLSLDLSSNEIGDTGMQALAKAFSGKCALNSLDLECNQITCTGADALAKMLKNNRILTSLKIAGNRIHHQGGYALLDLLKNNHTMTLFDLAGYQFIHDYEEEGNTLYFPPAKYHDVEKLLNRNVSLRNKFYEAIEKGDLAQVDLLLRQGVSLLFPAIRRNEDLLKSIQGNTPLHWSVKAGQVEVTRYLIKKMNEQSLPLNTKNPDGKTAEQLAFGTPLASLFDAAAESSTHSTQVAPIIAPAVGKVVVAVAPAVVLPIDDNKATSSTTSTSPLSKTPTIVSSAVPAGSPSSSSSASASASTSAASSQSLSPLGHLPISTSKPFSDKSGSSGSFRESSTADFFNQGNDDDRAETGRRGEEFFYNQLLKCAKEKFPKFQFINNDLGFTVENEEFLKVVWLNKVKEQRQPIDILVTFEGKEYMFEIKTTKGKSMNAFISQAEVEQLKDKKENYALVFITDINNKPQHFVQWNPHRKIEEGILELIPIKYAIYNSGHTQKKTDLDEEALGPEQPAAYNQCPVQ